MATVQEVMTKDPLCLPATSSVASAARVMRDYDIGDVVVTDEHDNAVGIVTDRDLAIRAVAEGLDLEQTELQEICSRALVTLSPTDEVETAAQVMREQALRRLPVVENGRPLGIVSLGDLARERDPGSVLADISEAPPNQ